MKSNSPKTVRTIDCPKAVMKYTMHSIVPGLGEVRGLWCRLKCKVTTVKPQKHAEYAYYEFDAIPLTKESAQAYIGRHGLVKLASDNEGELYGTPDNALREFTKEYNVRIPDNLGANTFYGAE